MSEINDKNSFEYRVKKEKNKLKKIFSAIDDNKKKFCETLIDRLAWLNVQVTDIEKKLQKEGTTIEYNHGGGQTGYKANPDISTLVSYTKNITTITKQLNDLVPNKENKSKLDSFLDD